MDFRNYLFDLHRHDEFSTFDGFGKAREAARRAKELGYPALGLSNHGNVSGLVKHYEACKNEGIIPVMGMEAYFQPSFDKDKNTYHLCLFAKNRQGWTSLMNLTNVSAKETFYKKPIVTFENLEQFSEGLICTSACVAGLIPKLIKKGNFDSAIKITKKFKRIFGDDFYLEVQPFKINEKHNGVDLQTYTNAKIIQLASKLNIELVMTSDSHFVSPDDYDTYLMMHKMLGTSYGEHYEHRYMHSQKRFAKAFMDMHDNKQLLKSICLSMKGLVEKIEHETMLDFELEVPAYGDTPEESYQTLKSGCIRTLKREGKWTGEYKDRLKYELPVIKHHGFQDYFLLVQDYVQYCRDNDIAVGPGRGSAGNSLVTYGLGITDVDPIFFHNDFDRFLRMDKKKSPDIDLDFCTNRRYEVIEYILDKYPDQSAQITSYGNYKAKYLVGDLAKQYDMPEEEVARLKKLLSDYEVPGSLYISFEELMEDHNVRPYNKLYPDIIKHFCKLFGMIRYFGKHAAAVAITKGKLWDRIGIQKQGGLFKTAFDFNDVEYLKTLKLDILGLKTVSMVDEMAKISGEHRNIYEVIDDPEIYRFFREGRCDGIFQFTSPTPVQMCVDIGVTNFEDVAAASSLNRPGPLSLRMHEQYAAAKDNPVTDTAWYKHVKATHGIIIYQEQIMRICRDLADVPWDITDKLVRSDSHHMKLEDREAWSKVFLDGAIKKGMTKDAAQQLLEMVLGYAFNRGHAIAYNMLSVLQMWYKVYFPIQFWSIVLKYQEDIGKREKFKSKAVADGCVVMLPHVNYTASDSIGKLQGEPVIREGLMVIKNVGDKAALTIEEERKKNGTYKSMDDFMSRVPKRSVNSRVVNALIDNGALEFNFDTYINRVTKYNATLYMKGM